MTDLALLDGKSDVEILTEEQLTVELLIPGLPDVYGRVEWERHYIPWKINSVLEDYVPLDMPVERVVVAGKVIPREEHSRYRIHYGAQIIVVPKIGDPGIVSAVIAIVLTLVSIALQFILAPTLPKLAPRPGTNDDATSFGFGGFRTDLHAGVPIPIIYGTHKTGGVLISSFLGVKDANSSPTRDTFNMLLLVSHGPVEDITDIKINNQPYRNFKDVTVDFRLGLSSQTVIPGFEEVANTVETSLKITNDGVTHTTTVGRNCIALEIIVRWLGGLMSTSDDGAILNNTFTYQVEYRETSVGGAYTIAGTRTVSRATRSQITNIFRIENLAPTQYDVRVTKIGAAASEDPIRAAFDAHLAGVTEITGTGRTYNNYAILGIRGVATDQLSGSVPQITCVVKGKLITRPSTVVAPPHPALIAKLSSTEGVIETGERSYIITYTTAGGETSGGTVSVPVSVKNNKGRINLSSIPISSHGSVTGRKIYRNLGKVPAPPSAPSATLLSESGGSVDVGVWSYAVTFITGGTGSGETTLSPASNQVPVAGVQTGWRVENFVNAIPIFTGFAQIQVTGIPLSSRSDVVGRRLYRRNGSGPFQFIKQFNDNTTASYLDTIRTAGQTAPSSNGSADSTEYRLVGTIADNVTTTFEDNISDASLGALLPTTNTATVAEHTAASWTDNPAWAVYDMLLSPIYGLGRWVTSSDVNLQSFKDAATFCDELVNNGQSGSEKRAIIDILINVLKPAYDLLVEDLCGPHRLTLLLSNGKWTILPDKVTTPTQMFSMGNIIRDSFKLQYSSTREQVNTLQIQFHDRTKDYEVETITVVSKQEVEVAGKPQKLKAQSLIGVTRIGQVVRESRYHLNNSHYLRRAIEFEGDIDAILMEAGDVFWFQHSLPEYGTDGGRIVSATADDVTLDHAVTLAPATTYKVRVRSLDGSGVEQIQEKTVTNAPGTYSVLTVDTPFNPVPAAKDIYGFGEVTAAQFRCLALQDSKDLRRRIAAIEYNANVYTEEPTVIPVVISTLPSPEEPPSHVDNLFVFEETTPQSDGVSITTAIISWTKGPLSAGTGLYGGVKIFYTDETADDPSTGDIDEGAYKSLATIMGANVFEYRWVNAPINKNLSIKVVAVNLYGIAASDDFAPVYNVMLTGSQIQPLSPSGIELVDQGSNNEFEGKDAKFVWKVITPNVTTIEAFGSEGITNFESVGIRDFVVQILVNGSIVRTEYRTTNSYTYTYEKNIEDNVVNSSIQFPQRTFTISVRSRSRHNVLSSEARLEVTNPAPDMSSITPSILPSLESLVVDWSSFSQSDYDLDHFRIYADIFNPPTTERVRAARGQNNILLTGLNALTTYFVKIQAFDSFGAGTASQIVSTTTAGRIGYKQTLNQKVFSLTTADDEMLASLVFDTFDVELDWLVKDGSDIHWGETTPNASVNTALGSKFLSDTKVRACYDDSQNHQIGILSSTWIVKYAKLSKDGTVLTSPTTLFTPSGDDRFINIALISKGSVIHWLLLRDVYSGAVFQNSKLQYARTDLSGSVQVSPTDIAGTSSLEPSDEVRCGVDSETNIHVLFKKQSTSAFQSNAFQNNAFQVNSGSQLGYMKLANGGAVIIPVDFDLILPPPGSVDLSPAGIFADASDGIHVIGYTYTGIGIMLSYARLSKSGELIVPATIFFSFPTTIKFANSCMDKVLNQIYCGIADSTGIYQIRLDPVDPSGLKTDSVFPRASL